MVIEKYTVYRDIAKFINKINQVNKYYILKGRARRPPFMYILHTISLTGYLI
ncbi:hypothetical protein Hore_15780 [Halothermothrix orenii H 168]|uniref:Uncharacterized protein n=1 Tax=Halothermothrix orenii (strain H 168 / OCM 544 / DSM 9562) TaxID=373903 RepID=B8CYF8_HALOH|nr:hypothetical protein Hore_15780 [Halothermothrix orenii H 168]